MRYKAVPPTPPNGNADAEGRAAPLEALATVRDALPLVPRSEDDCCARLVDRVYWIDERDVATEWILFLRALGLAEHSDAGYSRVRGEIDRDELAERFRDWILGASEVLDALEATADEAFEAAAEEASVDESPGVTPAEAFQRVETVVPEWERRRSDTWEDEWQTHTERLLAWATLLGFAAERGDGYVRT